MTASSLLDLAQVNQVQLPSAVGCEERDAEPDDTLEVVAHAPLAECQVEDEVDRHAREVVLGALEVTERDDGY
eukprot:3166433-Rhodomonas_salina.1